MKFNKLNLSIITLVLCLSALVSTAQTYTYTGTGNWTNVANWDTYPGTTIGFSETVIINGNATLNTSIDLTGTVLVFGTGTFINSGGNIQINAGGALINTGVFNIENSGTLNISGGGNFNIQGNMANSGTINNTGTIQTLGNIIVENTGIVTNNSIILINSGTINNTGTITNSNSFIVSNTGILNNNTGGSITNTSTLYNGTVLNNTGIVNNQSGGTFNNEGTLNNNTDGIVNNTGVIEDTGIIINLGTLSGQNISHTGDFSNAGTLNPGNTTGTYIFTNNYTQLSTAILATEIESTSNFDAVTVTGTVNLSGTLKVSLLNGYTPSYGDSFTIVTAGSISGTFSTLDLATNIPVNSQWHIRYTTTEVILELIPITYTYTGTGNWTTTANWSPIYPGTIINTVETVVINGNVSITSGIIENNGLITNTAGATISLTSSASFVNTTGAILTNEGIINLNQSDIVSALTNQGTLNNTTGEIIVDALFEEYLINSVGGIINNTGSITTVHGYLNNAGGIINNNTGGTITTGTGSSGMRNTAGGILNNTTGGLIVNANLWNNQSTINNIGIIENNNNLTNNGTIIDNGTITNNNELAGVNTAHTGDFSNSGILSPGNSANSFGTYTFTNNYTHESTAILTTEIISATSFDVVTVTGTANLSGTLEVNIPLSNTVVIGDTFTIVTAGNISGTFSTLDLATNIPTNSQWYIRYTTTEVILELIPITYTYTGTGNWTTTANWSPLYPGTTINTVETVVINGNVSITSGIIENNGLITNTSEATISLTSNASFVNTTGAILTNEGIINLNQSDFVSALINQGTLNNNTTGEVIIDGFTEEYLINSVGGIINNTGGITTIVGYLNNAGGIINNNTDGTITIGTGASGMRNTAGGILNNNTDGLIVSANLLNEQGILNNTGIIENSNGLSNGVNAILNNYNTINNNGTIENYSTGTINNYSVINNNDIIIDFATLINHPGGILNNNNILSGDNNINHASNYSNIGILSPGFGNNMFSYGTYNFHANYTHESTATLKTGVLNISTFDIVNVTGTATLNGTLEVNLSPSYTPNVGDTFTILTASSISGTFDTLVLPLNSSWKVNYTSTAVVLEVTTPVSLSAKVMLQGAALNPITGEENLMRDDLRAATLIPTTSPYPDMLSCAATVFNTGGTTGTGSIADDIVDWVQVELRDATTNTVVLSRQSALIQRDGDIVSTDGISTLTFNVPSSNYFIVIKHRNHLGIITLNTVALTAAVTTIDFTDANNQITFGTDAQTTFGMPSGIVAMWAGDANGDGRLNYLGAQSEIPAIRSQVFNDPNNSVFGGPPVGTYESLAYKETDINMDGLTVYLGVESDVLNVRNNIFNNPSNSVFGGPPVATYLFVQQLPEGAN